jgi:protein-tyrosine phosphatase
MYMNRIIPGLYVGSIMAQHDQAGVNAKGINAVLRLDEFTGTRWGGDFRVLHIPLNSRVPFSDEEIATCTEFIHTFLSAGETVLVQSQRGISRAVCMAMAYLIEYQGMRLPEAFVRILLRHPDAHPYTDQIKALVDHYNLPYTAEAVYAPLFFQRLVGEAQESVNHVHNGVYIGSVLALQQMNSIRALGIDAVLRLDRINRESGQWDDDFNLLDLPLPDGAPLSPLLLERGVEFLREQTSQKHKVLVHCQMGVSRASTFVIAHLMQNTGMNLTQAYQTVQKSRPIIHPNPLLVQSLVKHYGLPSESSVASQPSFLEDLLASELRAV